MKVNLRNLPPRPGDERHLPAVRNRPPRPPRWNIRWVGGRGWWTATKIVWAVTLAPLALVMATAAFTAVLNPFWATEVWFVEGIAGAAMATLGLSALMFPVAIAVTVYQMVGRRRRNR